MSINLEYVFSSIRIVDFVKDDENLSLPYFIAKEKIGFFLYKMEDEVVVTGRISYCVEDAGKYLYEYLTYEPCKEVYKCSAYPLFRLYRPTGVYSYRDLVQIFQDMIGKGLEYNVVAYYAAAVNNSLPTEILPCYLAEAEYHIDLINNILATKEV